MESISKEIFWKSREFREIYTRQMKDGPFLEQNPLSENLLARTTIPLTLKSSWESVVGKRVIVLGPRVNNNAKTDTMPIQENHSVVK